jgi:steroid 5-alpha reductase family enzyme
LSGKTLRQIVIYIAMTVVGCGFAWLVGSAGAQWNGLPIMLICAILAFGINALAAIPAIIRQTEHFYDLVGALTYATVISTALVLTGRQDTAALVTAAMVLIWCTRLGGTLFLRVRALGEDKRFAKIKRHPISFLGAWLTQGLWVTLTAICALAIIVLPSPGTPSALFWAGAFVWVIGFALESIADAQKTGFRSDPANRGRFITTGLWSWSQHPNYFGEILLWTGIAFMAVPVLFGWAWLCLISPIFVYLLLTRVSGIPLLDRQARERWGDDPAYAEYKKRTSKLFPFPPR